MGDLMKLGVNLWTIFGWEYQGKPEMEKIFEIVKEVGYDGLEFVYDDGVLDPARISSDARKRYLETVESLGLTIPSVATGVFWKYNLASPDERLRRRGLRYLREGIRLAHDLDAEVLLVVPGVAIPDVPYERSYELAKQSILKGARYAEDYGVIIAIENVWNKLFYSPLEFRRFLDDINHDYVKAYLDIANTLNFSYPEHWIWLLQDKIASVHAKDFDVRVGNITGFRHVGRGSVDWKKMIKLLKQVGYDGFLIVEAPPTFYPDLKEPKYPDDGIRAAKDNYEALRNILKEVEGEKSK
ncbi:MAG: hypothetical protein DRZ82_07800 [Thermoprotei archaeon]|nr:MAG: hypothetical protein DRZ82_07800 [Thermoprotei archaeon]